MRNAVSLLSLLLFFSTLAFCQSGDSQKNSWVEKVVASPGETVESTVLGCLAGDPDSYRLTEKDGTIRMLFGDEKQLKDYVGDRVALVGYADNDRDASASSDGTSRGLRFFRVEEIAELGSCKQR